MRVRFKPFLRFLMAPFLWSKFIYSVNKFSPASGRKGKVCTRQGTNWAVIWVLGVFYYKHVFYRLKNSPPKKSLLLANLLPFFHPTKVTNFEAGLNIWIIPCQGSAKSQPNSEEWMHCTNVDHIDTHCCTQFNKSFYHYIYTALLCQAYHFSNFSESKLSWICETS